MAYTLFKSTKKLYLPQHFKEDLIPEVSFTVHKFNHRRKLPKNRTVVISCFSEFGCETVGCLYCLPKLVKQYVGQYVIAVGWHGRAYLYKHLVDEFWELDPKYMFLRNRTYAFHFQSKNLDTIERKLADYGTVINTSQLGAYLVGNVCKTCGYYWSESVERATQCPACKSGVIVKSMFTNIAKYKQCVLPIPKPRKEYLDWAKTITGDNAVAVFARNRKTYNRNLTADFYAQLASRLQQQGKKVIWMGEKINSVPCPSDSVIDFVNSSYASDLERTLALICCCKFTVQFFTASSRLAGIMGVPFILFESPEQLYPFNFEKTHSGQEGKRLELTTFGPKKLVVCDYHSLSMNESVGLDLFNQAVTELENGNTNDIIGLVANKELVLDMRNFYLEGIK